jgi:signal transduction histidine kinase
LRRSLRDRATELESSRRLLLHAADAERDELQRRVVEEVASRIDAVATRLRPVSPNLAERARVTASELAHREFGIPAKGSLPELLSHFAAERVTVESAILSVDGIPPAVVRAAWFTCAEAVVNARKHAPGSSISIVARASAGLLRIEIRDTGPGGADEHGAGLRGLADRAEDLGGRLRVQSGSAGTRVQWAVPLDARSPALWIPASESRVTPDSKGSAPLLRSAP